MFDRWEYTIPANTAETAKKKQACKISRGTLTDLVIFYPAGCHGLARCQVYLGQKPIAPRNPSNYLAADDMPIIIRDLNERITGNRPVLNWFLWNVDETYGHTLWMSAEWISEDALLSKKTFLSIQDIADRLKRLF